MYVNIHLLHANVAINCQKPLVFATDVFSSFVRWELEMSNWYAVLFLSFELYYVFYNALSGAGSLILVEMDL